jgi:hypothetical protein
MLDVPCDLGSHLYRLWQCLQAAVRSTTSVNSIKWSQHEDFFLGPSALGLLLFLLWSIGGIRASVAAAND